MRCAGMVWEWAWQSVDRSLKRTSQPCLDWSERRYHLKGLVGARILDRLLELGWLKCVSGSRALQLTSSGRAGLSEIFQIEINNEGVSTGRLCDLRRLTALG